jgi:ABC-type transport system involved in multi-copper enzyme maturation permease subunit
MSTAVATPPTTLKVTQQRVLLSEWTKFRSLRSTVWTLLITVVLMIGLGALFSAVTANQYHTFSAVDRANFSAVTVSLGGIGFAQLAVGVLGVLLISGEYSTGMIRSSLTAVPRRLPVLWAKLGVFAAVVFAVSLVCSFVAFFLGQALLSGHHLNVSISSPGTIRRVIGAAGYLTLSGVIGIALGALLRNTAAGISTFVGAFFVIPPLTNLLPDSVSDHLRQYLPSSAGSAMYDGGQRLGPVIHSELSAGLGFALLCGYAVVLIAAAAWRLRRSDA